MITIKDEHGNLLYDSDDIECVVDHALSHVDGDQRVIALLGHAFIRSVIHVGIGKEEVLKAFDKLWDAELSILAEVGKGEAKQ